MANNKTNAMRLLEKAGIDYRTYEYDHSDGAIDGVSVATKMNQPLGQVFKTLVTQGILKAQKDFFVFVIPVAEELDLKAAARAVHEKNIELIKVADINKVTGYIRGGCSPIGMKKEYVTVLDSSCENWKTILVSAGKIGQQIELSPLDLQKITHAQLAALTVSAH